MIALLPAKWCRPGSHPIRCKANFQVSFSSMPTYMEFYPVQLSITRAMCWPDPSPAPCPPSIATVEEMYCSRHLGDTVTADRCRYSRPRGYRNASISLVRSCETLCHIRSLVVRLESEGFLLSLSSARQGVWHMAGTPAAENLCTERADQAACSSSSTM
jgi:hypothetical protein